MELAFVGRLLAACVVIALLLAALRLVARGGVRGPLIGARGDRLVAILETTALPGAASLHVVRVVDRYFVIGLTGASLATLCEISQESIVAGVVP